MFILKISQCAGNISKMKISNTRHLHVYRHESYYKKYNFHLNSHGPRYSPVIDSRYLPCSCTPQATLCCSLRYDPQHHRTPLKSVEYNNNNIIVNYYYLSLWKRYIYIYTLYARIIPLALTPRDSQRT